MALLDLQAMPAEDHGAEAPNSGASKALLCSGLSVIC